MSPFNVDEYVANLPRRTAHAIHALIEASIAHKMPVTAAEVCIYDGEAGSIVATGAALRNARRLELAVFTGRYWVPTNAALELRYAFEARYLRDTAREDDE